MTLDVTVWKKRAGLNLRQLGANLRQRVSGLTKAAPYAVYGSLMAATVWPLVQTAWQTGNVVAVGALLVGIAGSVGGNLIAEQLQRWADAADNEGEAAAQAQIVDWIEAELPQQPALREAGDALLQQADALPAAKAGLSDEDRAWFVQQLANEMHGLGNYAQFAEHLQGATIAEGEDAVAAASGAVVALGDVEGDINTSGAGNAPGGPTIAKGKGATAVNTGAVVVRGKVKGNINTGTQMTVNADASAEVTGATKTQRAMMQKLYAALNGFAFSEDDLRDLCFKLELDWDKLPGEAKRGKVEALVRACFNSNRLAELAKLVKEARPDLDV